jgi:hypothetical protein
MTLRIYAARAENASGGGIRHTLATGSAVPFHTTA